MTVMVVSHGMGFALHEIGDSCYHIDEVELKGGAACRFRVDDARNVENRKNVTGDKLFGT